MVPGKTRKGETIMTELERLRAYTERQDKVIRELLEQIRQLSDMAKYYRSLNNGKH